MAEAVDVYGDVVARAQAPVTRSPGAGAGRAHAAAASPARCGRRPVPARRRQRRRSRSTARPAGSSQLPDAPFLRRRARPARRPGRRWSTVPSPSTTTSTGRPAPSAAAASALDDFVYLFLGEGLGCAVVSDGEVRRGHAGLAGEIAHVSTVGPDGAAMPLTEVFAALGLRRPGSTAIDVPALLRASRRRRRAASARAVGRRAVGRRSRWPTRRSCSSAAPGARDPRVLAAISARVRRAAAPRPGRGRGIDDEPALTGAREAALQQLRDAVVAAAH